MKGSLFKSRIPMMQIYTSKNGLFVYNETSAVHNIPYHINLHVNLETLAHSLHVHLDALHPSNKEQPTSYT